MGYYNVEGADRETGKDLVVRVLAANKEDAAKQAEATGILISEIYESITGEQPENAPTPKSISQKITQAAPEYTGLNVASIFCLVDAILSYIVGIIGIVVGILNVNTDYIEWGMALLASGVLAHGFSAALDALRDIAINSFRSRF